MYIYYLSSCTKFRFLPEKSVSYTRMNVTRTIAIYFLSILGRNQTAQMIKSFKQTYLVSFAQVNIHKRLYLCCFFMECSVPSISHYQEYILVYTILTFGLIFSDLQIKFHKYPVADIGEYACSLLHNPRSGPLICPYYYCVSICFHFVSFNL